MTALFLALLCADLLSIAAPFFAYLLYCEWNRYHDTVQDAYADRCLFGVIALLLHEWIQFLLPEPKV